MKKIILLVVLLYASSCAVQYNEAYYMADFRPYTEEGFIISPLSSYAAPYKPLATICIEFTPGYDRTYVNEKIVESKVNDDMYLSANGKKAAMAVSDAGRNAEEVGRLCKIDRCKWTVRLSF